MKPIRNKDLAKAFGYKYKGKDGWYLTMAFTVNDMKELKKLLKLCRDNGVRSMSFDNMHFNLDLTQTKTRKSKATAQVEVKEEVKQPEIKTPDMPSDEELLFWSAEGYEPLATQIFKAKSGE